MRKKKWTKEQLIKAVSKSFSIRQVLKYIGLAQAGGNYDQINKFIKIWKIDTKHFTGKGWNIGLKFRPNPATPLNKILKRNSFFQS